MKHAKTLGVAALAALTLLVLAVTPSASGTVLCNEKPKEEASILFCAGASEYKKEVLKGSLLSDSPHGSEAGVARLRTPLGNVECTKAAFESKLASTGVGKTESLTLGTNKGKENCTTTITSCTKVEELTVTTPINTSTFYESTGDKQATPTESNGSIKLEKPKTTLKITCLGLPITCAYAGGENVAAQYYNPGNTNAPTKKAEGKGVLDFNSEVARSEGGLFCPVVGVEDITLLVEGKEGANVYVADNTKLCKEKPNAEGKCPAGSAFSGVLEGAVKAGTKVEFKSTQGAEGTVTCTKAEFLAAFQETGFGEEASLFFKGEGAEEKCKSTLGENPDVAVTFPELQKAKISYQQNAAPQGVVRFPLVKKLVLKWGTNTCEYAQVGPSNEVTNSEEKLLFQIHKQWERVAGGGSCPERLNTQLFEMVVQPKGGGKVWLVKS